MNITHIIMASALPLRILFAVTIIPFISSFHHPPGVFQFIVPSFFFWHMYDINVPINDIPQ